MVDVASNDSAHHSMLDPDDARHLEREETDEAPLAKAPSMEHTEGIDSSFSPSLWHRFRADIVHLKWRVLVLMCLTPYGSYYFYDVPGAIGTGKGATIQRHFLDGGEHYDQDMNLLHYSIYGYINVAMAFVWGVLIEKYLGLRKTFLIGTGTVAVAAALFWIGVITRSYGLMVTARVVFGMAGESITVAQGAMVSRWFRDGVAFPLGWTIALLRVAAGSTFYFSPLAANNWSVGGACFLAFVFGVFSFAMAASLAFVDRQAERRGDVAVETVAANSSLRLLDVILLPKQVVLISVISMLLYGALWPFLNVAVNFFEVKYNTHEDSAGGYVAIYQAASAIGSPLLGFFVDRTGRFTHWFVVSGLGLALVHVLFLVTNPPIVLMMLMFALFYSSLQASVWPVLPWAVPFTLIGVAFGLETSLFNLGVAVQPTIFGAVLTHHTNASNVRRNPQTGDLEPPLPSLAGYNITLVIMICTALLAVVVTAVLCIVDRGGVLAVSVAERTSILSLRTEAMAARQETEALDMEMSEQ